MTRRFSGSRGPSPGTITVCCLGPSPLRSKRGGLSIPARLDQYRYAAPVDAVGLRSPFDRLTLNAYIPADGNRRFVPRDEDGCDGYIARAFQIGHSVLARDRGWTKATFDDYCVGKLAYDWLCHARERLKPRNLTAEELVTPGYLRRDLLRRDALPDELTDGDEGQGGSKRVSQIAAAGAMAAAARGIDSPTETEILALGLMDFAAEQPPLAAPPEQIAGQVREALFDFGNDDEVISPEVWEEIGEQFEGAVRDRLLISQEEFNSWLYGKHAYMLQTVDKGASLSETETDDRRGLVRRGMLEKAWQGFAMVSECLDAFAQAFERAITRPLNEVERRLFRAMYRQQPHFGNFVLPMLLDAQDLVQHAILDLWEKPDDSRSIEVFQRMLFYRSQIVPRVRETQRRARFSGQALLESSNEDGAVRPKESLWTSVTGHILEQRRIACPHCDVPPICALDRESRNGQRIKLDIGCPDHGEIRQLTITRDEFAAACEMLYRRRASEAEAAGS